MALNIIILAAGNGRRMRSSMPKVMHPLGGIPMLERVVRTAQTLAPFAIYVIYSNGSSQVRQEMSYLPVKWIKQPKQLGTGHAVMQALPHIADHDKILILYGDVPLISKKTLLQLAKETPDNGLGLVITELDDPSGFGRIIRNEMGNIIAIVEDKDTSMQQRHIKEINTGMVMTKGVHLKKWLPKLQNHNAQQEYYLTDIVSLAVESGLYVGGVMAYCKQEVQGVNNRWQLANLERYYQHDMAKQLSLSGVGIMDINRIYIRGDIHIEKDVLLDINVMLEGKVNIGSFSHIGPNVLLKNVNIASNVHIGAHSVIEGAIIEKGSQVPPFSHITPGTVVKAHTPIGSVTSF